MQDRDGDDQDRPDETTIIVSNVLPVKLAKDEATGEWSVSWDLDKMRMGGKSTVYNKGTRDKQLQSTSPGADPPPLAGLVRTVDGRLVLLLRYYCQINSIEAARANTLRLLPLRPSAHPEQGTGVPVHRCARRVRS